MRGGGGLLRAGSHGREQKRRDRAPSPSVHIMFRLSLTSLFSAVSLLSSVSVALHLFLLFLQLATVKGREDA